MIILHIIFFVIFLYLAVSIAYFLVIAIAGRFGKLPLYTAHAHKKNICVIIPSYKEDAIIVDTARKAAAHDYPAAHFTVMVVADSLQQETIAQLRAIPVTVVEANVSMKSRSLNAAFQIPPAGAFDIAVILDADNVMAPGCLEKINDAFHQGCRAVQCHRTAKNQHTSVAVLDAISEEININLFRRGPAVLGISAAPIGSGMAFDFELIKEIFSLPHILSNPGEDREIDMQLMKRGIFMHFINDAYVYDEKVSSSAVFEKQRVRWLEAQINHVKRFADADMKGTPLGITGAAKLFQNLLLPRLLMIMVLGLFAVLLVLQQLFSFSILQPAPIYWWLMMAAYALVLFLSVPAMFYNSKTLRAVAQVPVLMFSMVKALLKIKAGRKEFLHTPKVFKS
ncbi:MAG TPA: glycosyltransferase [Chitinophagaceae bacterium]|nr:glycosyltransferase [Chitinophagaceae bacterium]